MTHLALCFVMAILNLFAASALAQEVQCTDDDGPSGIEFLTCGGVCSLVGTSYICSPYAPPQQFDGYDVWAVAHYDGPPGADYSIWGDGPSGAFACCYNEVANTPGVDKIILMGTEREDHYYFTYGSNNLKPANAHNLNGEMYLGESDGVEASSCELGVGSNYGDGDYSEHLHGEGDCDVLEGGEGSDHLYGGLGDDFLYGGYGGDRCFGGEGDDYMEGNDGNDALCDSTGVVTCATPQGNEMQGGLGVNLLWYKKDPNCSGILSTNSNAGPVGLTDKCGDSDEWLPWSGCDIPQSAAPDACAGGG